LAALAPGLPVSTSFKNATWGKPSFEAQKKTEKSYSLKPPTIRDFTNPAFFDVFFFSALKSEKKMWHRFQSGFRILATPQERKWKCLLNLNHAE